MVKNPPANAGDIRDTGSIPGSGRTPGEGHVTHSSILVWTIPCLWGHKESDLTEKLSTTKVKITGLDDSRVTFNSSPGEVKVLIHSSAPRTSRVGPTPFFFCTFGH